MTKYNEIKNASNTARQIHNFLIKRERNRKVLNLKLLNYNMNVHGASMTEQEFNAYFQGLEALGAGKVMKDTHGQASRFECSQPILEVIGAKSNNVVKLPRKRLTKEQHLKTVLVGLRNNVDISIQVPQDFNRDDAKRVYQLLRKAVG